MSAMSRAGCPVARSTKWPSSCSGTSLKTPSTTAPARSAVDDSCKKFRPPIRIRESSQAMALVRPPNGWEPRIERALEALRPQAHDLERASFFKLSELFDRVVEWNRRSDLTAARDPDELVDLFLADAVILAGAASTRAGQNWVDVGTGAGAPGLVLALVRPDLSLLLVEPKTKRVAFLRLAASELGAKKVRVERARGEDLVSPGGEDRKSTRLNSSQL